MRRRQAAVRLRPARRRRAVARERRRASADRLVPTDDATAFRRVVLDVPIEAHLAALDHAQFGGGAVRRQPEMCQIISKRNFRSLTQSMFLFVLSIQYCSAIICGLGECDLHRITCETSGVSKYCVNDTFLNVTVANIACAAIYGFNASLVSPGDAASNLEVHLQY